MKSKLYTFAGVSMASVFCLTAAASETASPVKASVDNGYIKFGSADGNYELKLDGRVQLDFGDVDADANPDQSDTSFRRVRLGLKTKLWNDWEGEFDIDFAGEQVNVKDMWLSYGGIPNWGIKVGNFKPHFSIDQVTSSRFSTFMEASIATDAVAPSRRIGMAADYSSDFLFFGGGFFGDKVNDETNTENADNPDGADVAERFGYSFRSAIKPYFDENTGNVFHVGLNYLNQKPRTIGKADRKNGSIKFAVVAENELDETEYLDTGRMYGADSAVTAGLELAAKYNRSIIIAEYLKTDVSFDSKYYTKAIPDASFDGYYVAYSYFVSGDRRYDPSSAEFANTVGKNAVEITARYSNADFNDASGGNVKKRSATQGALVSPTIGVAGGQSDIVTLGLNWYPNPNIMWRLNYLKIDLDDKADANGDADGGDSIDVIGARVQFTF